MIKECVLEQDEIGHKYNVIHKCYGTFSGLATIMVLFINCNTLIHIHAYMHVHMCTHTHTCVRVCVCATHAHAL